MTIVILESAKQDIIDGGNFYCRQGQAFLKNYFLDTIFSEIESLTWRAESNPLKMGFYRLLVNKFPYSVYYRIAGEVVRVYRVLDNRRNPRWIKTQLDNMNKVA